MPRYFFNTRIGDELIDDPEGEELRNPDRAWEVARAMILELLRSEGAEGPLLAAGGDAQVDAALREDVCEAVVNNFAAGGTDDVSHK